MYVYKSTVPVGLAEVKPHKAKEGKVSAAQALVAKFHAADALVRSLSADVSQETRDAAIASRDALAVKAKAGLKFVPDTSDGVTTTRYALDTNDAERFISGDAKVRAAIIKDAEGVAVESPVTPSIAAHQGMRAILRATAPEGVTPSVHFLSLLADGIFVLPSAARGASAKADAETPEARTARLAAALFADDEDTDAA